VIVTVNVYQVTMKPTNHSVHHVTVSNVLNVLECQITVLLVLKEESLHQNVISQNQLPNPLSSKMSQSDLSKLSPVTVVVILVKLLDLTV
jgi:hypothetical protein